MQQIEMRGELRDAHGTRHREEIFKERPIEGLAVESDQYGTFCYAVSKFVQDGVLFLEASHQQLLDLQAACVPPGQADEKRVRSCAAGESRRFRIEEEPLRRIGKRG